MRIGILLFCFFAVACEKPSPLNGTKVKINRQVYLEISLNGISGELDAISFEPKTRQKVSVEQSNLP